MRALAEADHLGPNGTYIRVGRSTLDRWIRAWRAGGFEALVPAPRRAEPRTAAELLELAERLKIEVPGRTSAQVRRAMLAVPAGTAPSERTLQRHFARVGLNTRPDGAPPRVFGRFQASARNDLWQGDGLHGPAVAGRKSFLLAFVDDYSRLLPGFRWGHGEDVVGLEAVLRAGVACRGVPKAILVDRGAAFVSGPFARACAVLGIKLAHARPRSPQTKGKVERFFATARSQFVVELEARGVDSLAELNSLFTAWVEVVYHRAVHSETKTTPLERFMEAGPPSLPGPELLREAFLWSERRLVTKTATVSLHSNCFEVDAALVGRQVELLFDPFNMERIEVRFEGRSMGLAVPVRIGRHVHPKVRAEAAPPPVPTGIDYLSLTAARHHAELARTISFAELANAGAIGDNDNTAADNTAADEPVDDNNAEEDGSCRSTN